MFRQPNANDMAREFRRTFSWKDARVHFIGVWYVYFLGVLVFVIQLVRDTVSSVGFGRGWDCLSGASAAAHACHIRHALALDERRVKFMPEFFLEMNSPDFHNAAKDSQLKSSDMEASKEKKLRPETTINSPNLLTSGESRAISNGDIVSKGKNTTTAEEAQPAVLNKIHCTQSSPNECNIKEVWFAGSHSDVYVHVDSVMSSTLRLIAGVGSIVREMHTTQGMFRSCGCVVRPRQVVYA